MKKTNFLHKPYLITIGLIVLLIAEVTIANNPKINNTKLSTTIKQDRCLKLIERTDTRAIPSSIGFSNFGKYVYVAGGRYRTPSGDPIISMYENNNGKLKSIGRLPAPFNDAEIKIDPARKYAYVISTYLHPDMYIYQINNNGVLKFINKIQLLEGTRSIAFNPLNNHVYVNLVAHGLHNLLYTYEQEPNGNLKLIQKIYGPRDSHWGNITVSPSGKYVYWHSGNGNKIVMYKTSTNGSLTPNGEVTTGDGYGNEIIIDHLERFAYVNNTLDHTISAYKIESNGQLNQIGVVPTGKYPSSITMDPLGKYIYITAKNDLSCKQVVGHIATHQIESNGMLSWVGAIALGRSPNRIRFDPLGKYLYVANGCDTGIDNKISVYEQTSCD